MIAPIKVILSIGSLGMIAQIVPVPVTGGPLDVGRLTFDGALVIAVGVLWKALRVKDEQNALMGAKVIETMTEAVGALKESRKSWEDSRKSSEDIGAAMDNVASNLAALTSTINAREIEKAEKKDHQRRHGVRPPA